jgi:hypothetical protein
MVFVEEGGEDPQSDEGREDGERREEKRDPREEERDPREERHHR